MKQVDSSEITLNFWGKFTRTNDISKISSYISSGKLPNGTKINLGFNNIKDPGATIIANALTTSSCPSNLEINLEMNDIRNSGAIAFAKAIINPFCPAGLSLNFNINNIGKKGIYAISSALTSGKCPPGLHIDIKYNSINVDIKIIFDNAYLKYQVDQYTQQSITLQQGIRQKNSIIYKLPQDCLTYIYTFIYPIPSYKNKTQILPSIQIPYLLLIARARLVVKHYSSYRLFSTTDSKKFINTLSNHLAVKNKNTGTNIQKSIDRFLPKKLGFENNIYVKSRAIHLIWKYHLIPKRCLEKHSTKKDTFRWSSKSENDRLHY